MIHESVWGQRPGAPAGDSIDLLHPYPTVAKALKIVANSRYDGPAKAAERGLGRPDREHGELRGRPRLSRTWLSRLA